MQRALLFTVLSAGVLLMSTAYAETPFGVPGLAPGQSLCIALDMPTVPNLRDVGGYQTRDGRIVARGIAYRSDTLSPMSADEIKKLALLALRNDYDLRTTAEVKAVPDELPPGVKYHLLNVLADAKGAAASVVLLDPRRSPEEYVAGIHWG